MSSSSSITNLFVTCPPGLESLLEKELVALGVKVVARGFGGVFVRKEMRSVYRINYGSRLAMRALWPLAHFSCPDRHILYREAKKIDWLALMDLDKTFSIDANVSHPVLKHSLFAAQVVKDALCDTFRDRKRGERPSVSLDHPDVQFNLFIHGGKATISVDTSGAPLFKRNWRKRSPVAPIQESLAATILTLANFSSSDRFCDPFCGSGTFLVEAALIATKTPPGFFRQNWGFVHLPSFSERDWQEEKNQQDSQRTPLEKGKIFGSDKDPKVIEECRENISYAGFSDSIDVVTKDVRSYFPSSLPTLVATNPPYGKRLQASLDAYRMLGDFLKNRCGMSCRSYVLSPSDQEIQETKLSSQECASFKNGGLPVKLFAVH